MTILSHLHPGLLMGLCTDCGSHPAPPVTDYTSCQLAAVSLNMTRPPQTCPGNYTANLGGAVAIGDPEPAKPHARIKAGGKSRSQRVTGSLPQMTLKQLLSTFYGIYLILQPLRLLLKVRNREIFLLECCSCD